MYAYIDESGNTGNKLFDPEQPLFFSAAMMTRTNFDVVRRHGLAAIARKVGMRALHANEMGVARIEDIADDLVRIVKVAEAKFFIARVEKMYLAATKVFNTYFDAGENLSVPWHVYWLRDLQLLMTFKLAHYVLTEEIASTVWECLIAPTPARSVEYFMKAGRAMLDRVSYLPDARSRQIAGGALEWGLANPECFGIHTRDKVNRNMHSPNFVTFTMLMQGIDKCAQTWGRPVREIVHDRQSQFEKTLQTWHGLFSRPELADVEPVRWPGETETMLVGAVPGSRLRMPSEEDSAGLQVIDIVLWLFKRVLTDKEIGPRGARLLNRVFLRGYQNDLSFLGVGRAMDAKLRHVMSAPLSDEQMEEGARLMARSEQNRIAAMRQYVAEKTGSTN